MTEEQWFARNPDGDVETRISRTLPLWVTRVRWSGGQVQVVGVCPHDSKFKALRLAAEEQKKEQENGMESTATGE